MLLPAVASGNSLSAQLVERLDTNRWFMVQIMSVEFDLSVIFGVDEGIACVLNSRIQL